MTKYIFMTILTLTMFCQCSDNSSKKTSNKDSRIEFKEDAFGIGDLNKDGIPDSVHISHYKGNSDSQYQNDTISIFFGTKEGGYQLFSQTTPLCCLGGKPLFRRNGTLKLLRFRFTDNISYESYTFRYQQNDFYLIGYDKHCKEEGNESAGVLYVNSFHHQAVDDAGKLFTVTATAPDGVIEAIESAEHKMIMGVQWHPEWMEEAGLPLFQWLVAQGNNFRVAKQLHSRIITLDTHCDTPMFFPQGIHFEQRDKRILVDLHKMTEGHQDAVIMAAYLPQPKMGDTFSATLQQSSSFAGITDKTITTTPYAYANGIFDQIEIIVANNSRYISIARTPADLYADKRQGRKSIMFAIENGLALEHDLANVKRFAQRGVVYITLCHNGDNDICDSARGCNTHDGVSQFGEQVIREMNHQGIMVDLSHAAEKSFYDALQISETPIVCSHSNCRSLCDHPRNLTDDQLRALAARGGVAHTTLYGGFLRQHGEASILDAISHLEHAIEVMGIDHVGLGTDFDGDGGVSGIADSSELINFTLQLLRRKYSERDIRKIWGGNWLRVMTEVQKLRG